MRRDFYVDFGKLTNEQKNYILTMLKDFDEHIDTTELKEGFTVLWFNPSLNKWCFVPFLANEKYYEVSYDTFIYKIKEYLILHYTNLYTASAKSIKDIFNY